ncbi:cytochrome P450 [Sphingobium sp. SCG-1]|uniref:cytochrome P450 n=1 Tax=Sphingobium sp. SCG-1 TaxID=2072936 RepID=UPI000CD696E3|nr:cytochrome P450 [Sphingobium sp. SCG-1]AUW59713.1 cytochrome P450 [Sphingobium sp. SCG-1]
MNLALSLDRVPDHIARAIVDPHAYVEWDGLHDMLAHLRRDHPFARADIEGYDPFWIASKYEDIQEVTRKNDIFLSGVAQLMPTIDLELDRTVGFASEARGLVTMNAPEHMKYRRIAQNWFLPKSVRSYEDRFRKLARSYVDRMAEMGGECDFFKEVAVRYPLLVIMSILGVGDEAEDLMMRFTQNLVNIDDPDLTGEPAPKTPQERAARTRAVAEEGWAYFNEIAEERRRRPTDDVASVIANAKIDGEPISNNAALGYYITIAIAGHDTTAASVAGALWALAERPEELAKVKADISLASSLAEEAVRWTTPIYHFARTAACDTEFRGQPVAKGDHVFLSFPSGNRDDQAFTDPFEFKADRTNNRQIGFSYGVHQCIGQHLARMEMTILFQELIPRLQSLELAGTPKRKITNFQGGPKSVPIRYKID